MAYDKHQKHFDKLASACLKEIRTSTRLGYQRAKRNLNEMTKHENMVWQAIQNKKIGIYFMAQWSIRPYILDFYAPDKKIAVEIDGPTHNKRLDDVRDKALLKKGIKTLRFTNDEVFYNLPKVLEAIKAF